MASYDALRHVSLGQYLPLDSLIHRLDPRLKLLGAVVMIGLVVWSNTYGASLFLLLVIVGLALLSRVSLGYMLGGLRPALPIIVLFSLMQLFFYAGSEDAREIINLGGGVRITDGGLRVTIVSLLRFFDLVFLTSLLTNTTTASDLIYAVERAMAPLDRLGLPGHELAMVGGIALRFLPILGETMESIMKAHTSRGVAGRKGGKLAFIENSRQMVKLIVPLFVEAYRRAEELAVAMEIRCYRGGRGRTHLMQHHMEGRDYLAAVALALIFGIVLVL